MAWEIPNANLEQKHVTFLKRENSLGKCLALRNHAERIVLDLHLNIWYTSVGEHLLKKVNTNLNADEPNGYWKVQRFFQFTSAKAILEVNFFNQLFHSLCLTSRKVYWKTTERSYHIIKTEAISGNAVPLKTHWQNVASVPWIVLNYRTALCQHKSKLEAFVFQISDKRFL